MIEEELKAREAFDFSAPKFIEAEESLSPAIVSGLRVPFIAPAVSEADTIKVIPAEHLAENHSRAAP